jgi:uncharacterized protein (TIGR02996 family)
MSTQADLLRAIRDNPDEDTPRLMYADYLDEEGDAPRAEFIRVQIERGTLPETDPRRRALEDREHALLAEHERDWLGVAHDADELTEWEFARGFVNEVAASPVFMNGPGTDLCAAHPVRRWRVMSGQNNFPADLRESGQRPWCARLEALDLSGWYAGLGEVSGFLTRSDFARLRELDLRMCGPLESLPELIDAVPFRDNLTTLRCGANAFDGAGLDVADFVRALGTRCALSELCLMSSMLTNADIGDLLGSPAAASLTSLDLQQNALDLDAVAAFRATRARLRQLDVSDTVLGGNALALLLGCRSLADLRELHVERCDHTTDSVRAITASPFWAQAEQLWMPRATVGYDNEEQLVGVDELLNPLFAAPGSPHLRALDIAGYALRDAGVARLCAAPWAGGLSYLDLSHNHLSDDALREIAQCGRFTNLRTLHLNGKSVYEQPAATASITDAGLRALADCPALANLRVLSLRGTRITVAGVEAVLNSPHFRLTALALGGCQLRDDAVAVFAKSPRTARLEVLDLSANDDIHINHLKQLADSEYLSPLTELDIRGISGTGARVRPALRARLGRRLSE